MKSPEEGWWEANDKTWEGFRLLIHVESYWHLVPAGSLGSGKFTSLPCTTHSHSTGAWQFCQSPFSNILSKQMYLLITSSFSWRMQDLLFPSPLHNVSPSNQLCEGTGFYSKCHLFILPLVFWMRFMLSFLQQSCSQVLRPQPEWMEEENILELNYISKTQIKHEIKLLQNQIAVKSIWNNFQAENLLRV